MREFKEGEKAKTATSELDSEQLNAMLKCPEQEDFKLTEYDNIEGIHAWTNRGQTGKGFGSA